MLTVDGVVLPAPGAMRMGYESVGAVTVTADGSTAADRLAVKRRAVLMWQGLGREDSAAVLSALTEGVFLAVTLPDPRAGAAVSLTMRVTALEAELLTADSAGNPALCRRIRAELRER